MSISKITSAPIQDQTIKVAFNRHGKRISFEDFDQVKKVAECSEDYYLKWNKVKLFGESKGLGIGAVIAVFEMVTATVLGVVEKSPATITNLLTTLSENVQVLIAGYERSSGKKSERQLKQEEENIEKAMAFVIAASGGLGLYKWGKDAYTSLKGEPQELESLSAWQKISLTVASLVSAVMMGVGYVEKSLMATLAKTENGGRKAKEIKLNASSDGRCSIEWFVMAIFLWVRKFKLPKMFIDLALPLNALWDGGSNLSSRWLKKPNSSESENDEENKIYIPQFFYNGFFLGNTNSKGLRDKVLPLFREFNCEPFDCNLNSENNLSVTIPGSKASNEARPEVKVEIDKSLVSTSSIIEPESSRTQLAQA